MTISDLAHQLHVSDLVLNQEELVKEFKGMVDTWKEVRAAMDKKQPVSMRSKWHPLYVEEVPP